MTPARARVAKDRMNSHRFAGGPDRRQVGGRRVPHAGLGELAKLVATATSRSIGESYRSRGPRGYRELIDATRGNDAVREPLEAASGVPDGAKGPQSQGWVLLRRSSSWFGRTVIKRTTC